MPEKKANAIKLPLIPLRELMLFPQMNLTFDVARTSSLGSLDSAMQTDQRVFLITQRDLENENPQVSDLYHVGTISTIKQVMSLPGEMVRVLVQGEERAELISMDQSHVFFSANVHPVAARVVMTAEMEAVFQGCRDTLKELVSVSQRMSMDTLESLLAIEDPDRFADSVASNTLPKLSDRLEMLECVPIYERMQMLLEKLMFALETDKLEKDLTAKIHDAMEKSQREYYLREQIKAAQNELGDTDVSQAMEEFLFGISYEQILKLKQILRERGIFSIGRKEVSSFLGETVKTEFSEDYRDFYQQYSLRRDNARARRRLNLPGPHKTIEDHFISFVMDKNREKQNKDALVTEAKDETLIAHS